MNSESTNNRGKLWGFAAAAGIIAFLALKTLADYNFWPALILAILIGILVAILFWIGFYRDAEEIDAAPDALTSAQVSKDGQPPLLKEPRAGGADDLKNINGVGPALQKSLNKLGIYHFDQIAAWRKKEIDWVDARLKAKGRIGRDGWVKQCKNFAKG